MRVLHDISNILEDELGDIVKTGGINRQDLEIVDKSIDIIKDIETIQAMRQEYPNEYSYNNGQSNRYYMYDDGYSMARGDRGGGRSSRDGRNNYGYARHDEKEMMEEKIDELKRQLEQMR